MRKILVLRGGALGDFLVTLPALALLRARWPEADIRFVGNTTAAALGVQVRLLDHVDSQHAGHWRALYATKSLPDALRDQLAAYDLIVNYWPDPDRVLARHFPIHAHQTFLTTGAHPSLTPAAAHYCAVLQPLGLHATRFDYSLMTPQADQTWVALHPGSGSPRKNWPLARWAALADWLRLPLGLQVFIVSGEAEPPDILSNHGTPWRNLPLSELATHLSRCGLFIGHDSGISHLAAATGTPSLLLFGPTDPATWAPPYPLVRVLRSGSELTTIILTAVQEAVTAMRADQT